MHRISKVLRFTNYLSLNVSHIRRSFQSSCMVFLFLLLLISAPFLSAQINTNTNITLIYPTGGESLTGNVTIQWRVSNLEEGMRIYLYYSYIKINSWKRINDEALTTETEYTWSTSALSDGYYKVLIELVTASNYVYHKRSEEFLIDNDNTNISISDIVITNLESSQYTTVKNGDDMQIIATIDNALTLSSTEITADLQGLGSIEKVYPDSFNGKIAVWNLTSVICTPSDGNISLTVSVSDIVHLNTTIIADNTKPQIDISKPMHGFYIFNKNFFPLMPSKSIIIGFIELELNIEEENEIVQTNIFLDSSLIYQEDGELTSWVFDTRLFGTHVLRVEIMDSSGNTAESSTICRFFNLF